MEKLYCVYNAKSAGTPLLIEIINFNKNGNEYSFNKHECGYLTKIKLDEQNLFIDYGLSMGDSPLEWIYIYTNDRILAEKILEKETESLGAGMYGGNYLKFKRTK